MNLLQVEVPRWGNPLGSTLVLRLLALVGRPLATSVAGYPAPFGHGFALWELQVLP